MLPPGLRVAFSNNTGIEGFFSSDFGPHRSGRGFGLAETASATVGTQGTKEYYSHYTVDPGRQSFGNLFLPSPALDQVVLRRAPEVAQLSDSVALECDWPRYYPRNMTS